MTVVCKDLSIGYGRKLVGSHIGLSVAPGEVVCLLGPNGCGKTTFFKTILGLIPALSGSVELGGKQQSRLSRRELARLIAFVPQQHGPVFPFEVLEVVTMGRTPRLGLFAQPSGADRQIALEALVSVGIEDLATRDYSRLSGGQRQLVLIARALAQQASVLVMDEPTASLDFGNQMRVLEKIRDLSRRGQGRAVVLSTHDPDQAFALMARVVLMKDGNIHAEGTPDEVLTGDCLTHVYGTAVVVETTTSGRKVCLPPLGLAAKDTRKVAASTR